MSPNPPDGTQEPEYLEQGGGEPVEPARGPATGRRRALLVGGAVAGLAVVGGGVWAATWYLGSGPQPAEALPASTLGYASIDLDPSGGQKVEAIRTLNRFPAFEGLGLHADDDIKKWVFEKSGAGDACPGLDYAADIEPWLGDRAAVAAVDLGEEQPTVAGVVQVTDAAVAEQGLSRLRDCGGDEAGGWVIDGDWAVLAETDDIAQEVVDGAAKATLADDEDYRKWTGEAGDAGVVSLYAAPEAGRHLAGAMGGMLGFGMMPTQYEMSAVPEGEAFGEDMPAFPDEEAFPEPEVPAELRKALEDFEGMALTVRFDDGAVELEVAGGSRLARSAGVYSDAGDDVLSTLPDDTAAALGVGLADGWFGKLLDQMASMSGGMSPEQLIEQAEVETGLALPEDAETLAGDSAAVAVGGDFDPEAFVNSEDGTDLPIGLKVQGDPGAIEDVLAKLQPKISADGGPELVTESDGDVVAIGVNERYVSGILDDGGLGDSDIFANVVREAESAGAILFVNFDAGDGWLDAVVDGDADVAENVKPLEGLGMSAWQDGDVSHGVLRLTTD